MVVTWLLNSIVPESVDTFLYANSAYEVGTSSLSILAKVMALY